MTKRKPGEEQEASGSASFEGSHCSQFMHSEKLSLFFGAPSLSGPL